MREVSVAYLESKKFEIVTVGRIEIRYKIRSTVNKFGGIWGGRDSRIHS